MAASNSSSSNSNFRISSKNIFLTFPQCPFPLESFKQNLLDFFESFEIEKGVCSQENHQDGNQHLHAYLCLKKKFESRNIAVFDSLVSPAKHPNIVSRLRGGPLATIQYVIKEGNYQVLPSPESFDLQAFLLKKKQKKSTKSTTIAMLLKSGATLQEIDQEEPGYLLQHLPQVQRYMALQEQFQLQISRVEDLKLGFHVSVASSSSNTYSNRALASWLNSNIRTMSPRPHRTPQMWIKAMGGAGKTETINRLRDTFRLNIFIVPYDEVWWDRYDDELYDLILFDEFKGQVTITKLNQILSGDHMFLSRRGQPPYLKKKNLPVLILSNYMPHEAYTNCSHLSVQPLVDRLTVIDFTVEDYPYVRVEPDPLVPLVTQSDSSDTPIQTEEVGDSSSTSSLDDPPSSPPIDIFQTGVEEELELESLLDPEFDENNEPWMWDPDYQSDLLDRWNKSTSVSLKSRQKKRQKTNRVIEDYFE